MESSNASTPRGKDDDLGIELESPHQVNTNNNSNRTSADLKDKDKAYSESGSVVNVDEALKTFRQLENEIHTEQRKADVEAHGGAADWDIHEFFEESVRYLKSLIFVNS